MSGPRIGVLLPTYSKHSTSQMPGVLRMLADLGATVDVIVPPAHDRPVELSRLRVEHDLYVLHKISGLALSLAGALHELGATIVNPYPATAALRDKIVATRILQSAGVPVPDTYVAADTNALLPLLEDGPIVVKPYQGAGGHHVQIVRTSADLSDLDLGRRAGRDPVFAQRYHEPQGGRDRKLYVIGDRCFGVMKVFPRRSAEEKQGEPFAVSHELRDIALRCGRAFGVELYGVDIIESAGTPYVVDVGTTPGYKGVPDAPRLVAEYLYAAAERARPVPAPAAALA
jgi:ribosomal protein S6--L-glutamate ligase